MYYIGAMMIVCACIIGGYLINYRQGQARTITIEGSKAEYQLQTRNEKEYDKVKEQLEKDRVYFEGKNNEFRQLHEGFQAHDFFDANIYLDGPQFTDTYAYLKERQETYDHLREEVLTYLSKENIEQRGKDLEVADRFEDVYQEYEEKNFGDLREDYRSSLPKQIIELTNIFDYLRAHEDGWAVDEERMIFDDEGVYEEYQRLLNDYGERTSEE